MTKFTKKFYSALFMIAAVPMISYSADTAAKNENESKDGNPAMFYNASAETGLDDIAMQNGIWADINHDGWPDLLITGNDKGLKTRVLLNIDKDGKRTFKDFTEESGLLKDTAYPETERRASFFSAADVNNDGFTDLLSAIYCEYDKPKTDKDGNFVKDEAGGIVYEKQDDGLRTQIYINDGKGHFTQVKGNAFPPETITGAVFLDYDKDGIADLFTVSWYKEYGISLKSYPDRLYRGNGDGTFTDVTEKAGMMTKETEGNPDSSRPSYGASHGDWNNDGYDDIFVSVYGRQANRLWKNNGDGTFTEMAKETGFDGDEIRHGKYPEWVKRNPEQEFRSHGNTFSAAPADYDCDGDLDIFIGEITHGWAGESSDRSSLLVNRGKKGEFKFDRYPDILTRVHQSTKNWNQGDMRVSWADIDNDGRQELLVSSGDYPDGQYLRIFKYSKPLKFEEITKKTGIDWESSATISVADYDNDGCLDIIAGKSWMRMPKDRQYGRVPYPGLFVNKCENGNNWAEITLQGKGQGFTAKGATGTKAVLKTGFLFKHSQMRYMETSHGHMGLANHQRLHFGLGKNKKATITVYWNSGAVRYKIPANRFIRITEGNPVPEISEKPFSAFP